MFLSCHPPGVPRVSDGSASTKVFQEHRGDVVGLPEAVCVVHNLLHQTLADFLNGTSF